MQILLLLLLAILAGVLFGQAPEGDNGKIVVVTLANLPHAVIETARQVYPAPAYLAVWEQTVSEGGKRLVLANNRWTFAPLLPAEASIFILWIDALDLHAAGIAAARAVNASSRISAFTGQTHVQELWDADNGRLGGEILAVSPAFNPQRLHELIHRAPFTDRELARRFLSSSWSKATCHYAESFASAVQDFFSSDVDFDFYARVEAARRSYDNLIATRLETTLMSMNLLRLTEEGVGGTITVTMTDPNTRRSHSVQVPVGSLRSRGPDGVDSLPHARLVDNVAQDFADFVQEIFFSLSSL
jgi:hypothetical protein